MGWFLYLFFIIGFARGARIPKHDALYHEPVQKSTHAFRASLVRTYYRTGHNSAPQLTIQMRTDTTFTGGASIDTMPPKLEYVGDVSAAPKCAGHIPSATRAAGDLCTQFWTFVETAEHDDIDETDTVTFVTGAEGKYNVHMKLASSRNTHARTSDVIRARARIVRDDRATGRDIDASERIGVHIEYTHDIDLVDRDKMRLNVTRIRACFPKTLDTAAEYDASYPDTSGCAPHAADHMIIYDVRNAHTALHDTFHVAKDGKTIWFDAAPLSNLPTGAPRAQVPPVLIQVDYVVHDIRADTGVAAMHAPHMATDARHNNPMHAHSLALWVSCRMNTCAHTYEMKIEPKTHFPSPHPPPTNDTHHMPLLVAYYHEHPWSIGGFLALLAVLLLLCVILGPGAFTTVWRRNNHPKKHDAEPTQQHVASPPTNNPYAALLAQSRANKSRLAGTALSSLGHK